MGSKRKRSQTQDRPVTSEHKRRRIFGVQETGREGDVWHPGGDVGDIPSRHYGGRSVAIALPTLGNTVPVPAREIPNEETDGKAEHRIILQQ